MFSLEQYGPLAFRIVQAFFMACCLIKQGDKFTLLIFAPFINTESDTSLGDGSHGYDLYSHIY